MCVKLILEDLNPNLYPPTPTPNDNYIFEVTIIPRVYSGVKELNLTIY